MTLTRISRVLLKNGFTINETEGLYRATKKGFRACVEWRRAGRECDEACCLRARQLRDEDEPQSDYSAGAYCPSLKQAMSLAELMHGWAMESEAMLNGKP